MSVFNLFLVICNNFRITIHSWRFTCSALNNVFFPHVKVDTVFCTSERESRAYFPAAWNASPIRRTEGTTLPLSPIHVFKLPPPPPPPPRGCGSMAVMNREGWPMLTIETEANGDSRSTITYERCYFLFDSLGLSCLYGRFWSCLGCSSRSSTKYFFPHRTLFHFICSHHPADNRAASHVSGYRALSRDRTGSCNQ
jgi:hypothetical protein